MRARRAMFVAALAAVCGACSSKECQSFEIEPLDEARACLDPAVPARGLSVCHDTTQSQGTEGISECLIDASGMIYLGALTMGQWIEPPSGAGWTYADDADAARVLPPADAARCAPLFTAPPPKCP